MANHFSALHAALRRQVDRQLLPGVCAVLMQGRQVVDRFCYGYADREAGIALREDHIFRVFSNTKLVTSCAALMLMEDGRLELDHPIEAYIPDLGGRQVLRPGAIQIDDTEPATTSITIRHLMTHTAGFSYGAPDQGALMSEAYNNAGVRDPKKSLNEMINALAQLPLSFQPGTQWEYSVATDVLGRLVEIVSGESLGAFLSRRIFEPLGMPDTGFWVPEGKHDRLCALYAGADIADPSRPGLTRLDDKPFPGAYLRKPTREAGGGGLVSTINDTVRLIQSLVPGGPTLLRPSTLNMMWENQLARGVRVQFPNKPRTPGRSYGLASSVSVGADSDDPTQVIGEVGWGGMAGTIWWINPRLRIAAVLMTQRYFGFDNPYSIEFKKNAYQALGH